jgi:hypothetical protein
MQSASALQAWTFGASLVGSAFAGSAFAGSVFVGSVFAVEVHAATSTRRSDSGRIDATIVIARVRREPEYVAASKRAIGELSLAAE